MDAQSFAPSVPGLVIGLILLIPGVIIGSALGQLAEPRSHTSRSLNDALFNADTATDFGIRWPSHASRSSRSDDRGLAAFIVLVFALVLGWYVNQAPTVSVTLYFIALAVFIAVTSAFAVLWWHRFVDGTTVALRLLLVVPILGSGFFNATWLIHPPLHAGALTAAQNAIASHGVIGWIFTLPPSVTALLFLQLVGAILTVVMLVSFIGLCLATISSAFMDIGARPELLWSVVFWCNKWAAGPIAYVIALAAGLLALALTSGLALDWVHDAWALWMGLFRVLTPHAPNNL
ncbi:hypothetical protein [Leifsonia sp. NPDC058248]|uniref:hypothetical protein n=1 Tax=Leifsonia sp. NPDC058248 TaxID=3346402 RepID=UPI0036D7AC53